MMGDGEWADLKKRRQFDTKYNFSQAREWYVTSGTDDGPDYSGNKVGYRYYV